MVGFNRTAADSVRHIIAMACTVSKLAEWLFALPLLHFLNGDIKPFHNPGKTDEKSLRWWGLEGIKNEIGVFLKQTPSGLVFNTFFSMFVRDFLPLFNVSVILTDLGLYSILLKI